jgi:hypothetical protein
MKKIIKRMLPGGVLSFFRKLRRGRARRINESKSTEEVFTEIYSQHKWGVDEGNGEFCSGGGTVDERIADAYMEKITELSRELDFSSLRAVDLGCGDMKIGERLIPFFKSYLGVDIVQSLIDRHAEKYAGDGVTFQKLDMVTGELPDGDVCMIRQVLQHLSNSQVSSVLGKLKKYRYVIITEHLPSPNPNIRKNKDKPHGSDIRIFDNSGIYLADPPFSLPQSSLDTILEVKGHDFQGYADSGIIQTVLYRPGGKERAVTGSAGG